MNAELRSQFTAIRNAPGLKPRAAWVSSTRERVLSAAQVNAAALPETVDVPWVEKVSGVARLFVPAQLWQTARAAAIFFLAGSVAVGGWIVGASASQDSLPGEPLYGVKLAIEKTEVAVAGVVASPRVAAAKELDFAARRVTEVKNSPLNEQKVVALQSLQESMQSANKRLEQTVQDSPEQALAVAQVVNEKTEQILDTLHASTVVLANASTTPATTTQDIAVTAQVQETEKLIEQTGVQAVQVLIEKGDSDSVKETVEKKLEKVASDVTDVTAQAANAIASSTVANAHTVNVSTTPAMAIVTSTPSTASGTTTISMVPIGQSDTSTIHAGTSTVQLPDAKQVQDKIGAAKDLLDDNNLLGALQKVKELYDIKNEAKTVVIKIDIAKSVAATVPIDGGKVTSTSVVATGTPLIVTPNALQGASTTVRTASSTKETPPQPMATGAGSGASSGK